MKLVRLTRSATMSHFGDTVAISPLRIESVVDMEGAGARICFGGEEYLDVQEDFEYACSLVDEAMGMGT